MKRCAAALLLPAVMGCTAAAAGQDADAANIERGTKLCTGNRTLEQMGACLGSLFDPLGPETSARLIWEVQKLELDRREQQRAALDEQRAQAAQKHAGQVMQRCIKQRRNIGTPWLGATPDEAAICAWGWPESTQRYTSKNGIQEHWLYTDGRGLTFLNGRLQLIKE